MEGLEDNNEENSERGSQEGGQNEESSSSSSSFSGNYETQDSWGDETELRDGVGLQDRHHWNLEPVVERIGTTLRQRRAFIRALNNNTTIRSIEIPCSMRDFLRCEELWTFCRTNPSLRACEIAQGRDPVNEQSLRALQICLSALSQNSNGFPKELEFTEIGIEDDSVDDSPLWMDITEVIGSFDTLETLRCRACPRTLNRYILEGLLLNPSIKSVELSPGTDWSSREHTLHLFESFVQSSTTLTSIEVSQMTNAGMQCLARAVRGIRNLATLKLSTCTLGWGHGRIRRNDEYLDSLALVVRNSSSLRNLSLRGFYFSPTGYRTFCQAAKESSVIQKLSIYFQGSLRPPQATSNYLAQIIQGRTRSLRDLELRDYSETDFSPASFQDLLGPSTSLRSLRLCIKSIDSIHLSAMLGGLRRNETLKELYLYQHRLGPLTGANLPSIFDTNSDTALKKLCIACSNIGPELIESLALTLASCGFECLSLSGFESMTPNALDSLFLLSRREKLKELKLFGNSSNKHIKVVSKHLPYLEHLTNFSTILPSSFKPKRRLALIEAIKSNQSLESLYFGTSANTEMLNVRDMCIVRNAILRMKRYGVPGNLWPLTFQKAAHLNPSGLFLALRLIAVDFSTANCLKRKAVAPTHGRE